MRLSNLFFSLLMTLAIPVAAGCASDSGDSTGPIDDGSDDDDGSGGGDGSGDGMDDDDGDDGGDGAGSPDGGGTTEEACAEPGATGNAGGVGEYCTEGGGECDDNDAATYCTVDYQDGAPPFCTMPCFGADECGEDATCADDGGPLMGCAPLCVAEGGP